MKGKRKVLRRVALIGGLQFALFVVVTWPTPFVSESRKLMGASFDLTEIAAFDDGSVREGVAVWFYQLPAQEAAALDADRAALRNYPMNSALFFDGYKRVPWQTFAELKAGPHATLADRPLYAREVSPVDIASIRHVQDAEAFAATYSRREDILIAGWYAGDANHVSKYFIYILDLKNRLLIKLALLT